MVWDFTCVDPLAISLINDTLKSPVTAAEKAEKAKVAKYKQLQRDYYMVPIAVETYGAGVPRVLT